MIMGWRQKHNEQIVDAGAIGIILFFALIIYIIFF